MRVVLAIGFFGVLGVFIASQLTPVRAERVSDSYDFHLNEGLKSEALKNWPDAVAAYMRAIEKDPRAALPRERIVSIFKSLKSKRESTQAIELLINVEIKNELVLAGVFQPVEADQSSLTVMSYVFWGSAFIVLLIVAISLGMMFRKKQAEFDAEKEKLYERTTGGHRRSTVQPKADRPDVPRLKKDVKVTDQTKSEMTDLISNVKTLTGTQARPDWTEAPAVQQEQIKALESSEVLQALAQTMLSEVTTENAPEGKFSKLSLDASLVFDETDTPPDLEQVKQENPKDPSVEEYLARLAQKEASKGKKS